MIGKRHNQLNHTQIRLNFPSLNFHLYQRKCINSPNCSCGDTLETPHHYFFLCPQFTQQRNILFSKLKKTLYLTNSILLLDISNHMYILFSMCKQRSIYCFDYYNHVLCIPEILCSSTCATWKSQ